MERLERLREVEAEIGRGLSETAMGWSRVYALVAEVADDRLWAGSYSSLASWMRSFGQRANVSPNYLNRVLSSGRAYEGYRERSLAAGRAVPELAEAKVSALSVAEARRVSAGRPEAFDSLMGALLSQEVSPTEIRRMAAAGAGMRVRGRRPDALEVPRGPAAEELLWPLSPTLLGYVPETSESPLRRVWQAFPEVSEGGFAASLVVTNCLVEPTLASPDAPEMSVDLLWFAAVTSRRAAGSCLKQVPEGVDYRWLVVPREVPEAFEEVRGHGWGLILWDGPGEGLRVVRPAPRRKPSAEARGRLLEKTLVRVLRRA